MRSIERRPQSLAIGWIARRPAQQPLRLAVRDAAVFGIEGARGGRQAGVVQRLQRRQRGAEQRAAPFDDAVAMHGFVVGEVVGARRPRERSEEHTSELQSLMRISYAVFCLKKKKALHSKNQ